MIPLRLIGPKVLVALEPKPTSVEDTTGMNYHDKGRTASGIILVQPTDVYESEEHSRGLVVALGEKKGVVELELVRRAVRQSMDFDDLLRRLTHLAPASFDMAIGDVVLFPPTAGVSLGEQDDGIYYVLLNDTDIQAVIQPKESAVA